MGVQFGHHRRLLRAKLRKPLLDAGLKLRVGREVERERANGLLRRRGVGQALLSVLGLGLAAANGVKELNGSTFKRRGVDRGQTHTRLLMKCNRGEVSRAKQREGVETTNQD